jgi:phosphatidylinositol 4-kinase
MIDIEGHMCHIDFGFLLSNAPGKGLSVENAPFKLTQEMIDVLGG